MVAMRTGLGEEEEAETATSSPSVLLPVSPDLLHDEMRSVQKLLEKHIKRLNAGLPGVDRPEGEGGGISLEAILKEMVGELLYGASKLESLARVLNGEIDS